jgi:ABC-type Fe3+-hydroxamate transport system substrate-binding protein
VSAARLVDAAGVQHEPGGPDARIACLIPSITELLCDLGLAGNLVARTGFCIHPREVVRTVPKVGGTKDVKLDRLRSLEPTHVILNVDENRRETAASLAEFVPNVIITHPLAPSDNLELYRLLGGIFDRVADAERLCNDFAAAYSAATAGTRLMQRVLYLIWRDPWMTISRDTYISRTLALFNWQTEPEVATARYPTIDLEVYAGVVDRVLLPSEPYRFRGKHLSEVEQLIPGAAVELIDGEMTSWYGSRAIVGLRYLADYTSRASR